MSGETAELLRRMSAPALRGVLLAPRARPASAEMRRYRVTPKARFPADSACSLRDPCRSAIRHPEDGDHPLQIVGENVKAHLRADLFEGAQPEVGRAHPRLDGSEWMFRDL